MTRRKGAAVDRHRPLDTWERILDQLARTRQERSGERQIEILMELLVNLRLLGKEEGIPDRRDDKGDSGQIYGRILEETKRTLRGLRRPSDEHIFYLREIMKRLPIRHTGPDLIEDIRGAAEEFEERRPTGDPLAHFAGDLRKEVHRRLSPRILDRYLIPYLELVEKGNAQPMREAGYLAVAERYVPGSEDPACLELARELESKLTYLWDYDHGNLDSIRRKLAGAGAFFERCFLKREMQSFLEMLTPRNMKKKHVVFDLLRRLISFKQFLKKSYEEGRIELFEFLNVDLDLGRLIFIFENDLTNHHYREITIRNVREALDIVKEMLNMMMIRGFRIGDFERFFADLDELRAGPEAVDLLKTRRRLQSITASLQAYLNSSLYIRLGTMLNHVLEAYGISTSRLSRIKDRFFNNLIRQTCFHVLSEFIETILSFIDRELAARSEESNLYGRYRPLEIPRIEGGFERYIATTWQRVPPGLRQYLGGKGNGLVDMCRLGVRTPPAFILGVPICGYLLDHEGQDESLREVVFRYLRMLEQQCGKRLGDPADPLLVSVRSGAAVSMPGTMITFLNCGINDAVAAALERTGGERFAREVYSRFLRTCLESTAGPALEDIPQARRVLSRTLGSRFFSDPFEQIYQIIRLVARSSASDRVVEYLRELSIGQKCGTAITIQQMVFGNLNSSSSSGVLLTRNPISGKDELYGEYKTRIQGEDVVMGKVIPDPLTGLPAPIRRELLVYKEKLERHFRHELDIEFTVEDGRLYLLQARQATLSPFAKLITDLDFLDRRLIDPQEFKRRLERLSTLHDWISIPNADFGVREWNLPVSRGVPIRNGIVSGSLALSPQSVEALSEEKHNVIYFAWNTQPSDFRIITRCQAIATIHPGRTSHAAITAITLNKPCVVGCANARIDLERRLVIFRGKPDVILREGERITLDANTGMLYRGPASLSDRVIRASELFERVREIPDGREIIRVAEQVLAENTAALKRESGYEKRGLSSYDRAGLRGRNVLIRLDFNIPMENGQIVDPSRIELSVPTIREVLEAGGTPILCSHLGDPGIEEEGKSREELYEGYSLKPVARLLERYFPGELRFLETSIASSGLLVQREDIVPGRINMLENLRFALGEKENDAAFSRSLAGITDGVFINDAFGVCHRRHASITGVPQFVDTRLAGLLVEKELEYLGRALDHPQRPFVAVIGGAGLAARVGTIESILLRTDTLAMVGEVAQAVLKAAGAGRQPGAAPEPMAEACRRLLKDYGEKIVLSGGGIDLDPQTMRRLLGLLERARTIFWYGTCGRRGTAFLAREMARLSGEGKIVIVCGKETVRSVRGAGMADRITHLSAGDEASLEFIERAALPGISCLDPRL